MDAGVGGEMGAEINEIDIYTLLCKKYITNENQLCSTENSLFSAL